MKFHLEFIKNWKFGERSAFFTRNPAHKYFWHTGPFHTRVHRHSHLSLHNHARPRLGGLPSPQEVRETQGSQCCWCSQTEGHGCRNTQEVYVLFFFYLLNTPSFRLQVSFVLTSLAVSAGTNKNFVGPAVSAKKLEDEDGEIKSMFPQPSFFIMT